MQFNFVGMCKLHFVFPCFEVHARWININKFYDSLTKTLPWSRMATLCVSDDGSPETKTLNDPLCILNKEKTSVCVWHCLSTLDGDLGIGGGPPGLRVWLDASLPLSKQDREKEGEEKKTNYRESNEDGKQYEIKEVLKKQLNAKTWHALQDFKLKVLQKLSCKKSESPFMVSSPLLSCKQALFVPPVNRHKRAVIEATPVTEKML